MADFTNDELQALLEMLELSSHDDRQAALAEQLAQAQALQKPRGQNYGTVAGNTMGGLADLLRQGTGMLQERGARGQQEALRGEKLKHLQGVLGMRWKMLQPSHTPNFMTGDADAGLAPQLVTGELAPPESGVAGLLRLLRSRQG